MRKQVGLPVNICRPAPCPSVRERSTGYTALTYWSTPALVHKDLVTDDDILDGEVTIGCAHGDTSSYPLAAININIGGKDIITTPVYLAPSPHWLFSDGTSPSCWTSSPTDGTSKTARTRWQLLHSYDINSRWPVIKQEPSHQEVKASLNKVDPLPPPPPPPRIRKHGH